MSQADHEFTNTASNINLAINRDPLVDLDRGGGAPAAGILFPHMRRLTSRPSRGRCSLRIDPGPKGPVIGEAPPA